MDTSLFKNDQNLVHGEISIADSLTAPSEWGIYSIRLPYNLPAEKLASVKIILWSCMDRRVVRPLFNQLLQLGYKEGEILIISMGGGPIQAGDDRIGASKELFSELEGSLPRLEKIWAVAHTKTCGGIKHFCGGKPITEVAKKEFLDQAAQKGIDQELYLTDLILEGSLPILPQSFRAKTTLEIAEPDEANQTVIIHPHQINQSEIKSLAEVIAY